MARVHNSHSKAHKRATKIRVAPRKEAKQERSRSLVEALLRATARILTTSGYAALTTNEVAARAGVSVGSLYQYFPNKDALVYGVLERHIEQSLALFREQLPRLIPLPVAQAVRRFVELLIDNHKLDPELHRVFVEQLPRVGAFKQIERSLEEGLALAHSYLLAHSDEIVPQNLELASFVLVHTVESLTHAAVLTRPDLLGSRELTDEISACAVRYLLGGHPTDAVTRTPAD